MNTTLTRLNNVAVFLTFALSLAVKGGYNYGAGILFLAALLTLPKWCKSARADATCLSSCWDSC